MQYWKIWVLYDCLHAEPSLKLIVLQNPKLRQGSALSPKPYKSIHL